MSTSSWALQTAIFETLIADANLSALLGGPKVFDHVPRGTRHPYVTFAQSVERDWSTGSSEGGEHLVTLHVWSEGRGRRECQALIAAVRDALHEQLLTLNGHRLINLRHDFSETRRERDDDVVRGLVRFRAVTEPMA